MAPRSERLGGSPRSATSGTRKRLLERRLHAELASGQKFMGREIHGWTVDHLDGRPRAAGRSRPSWRPALPLSHSNSAKKW